MNPGLGSMQSLVGHNRRITKAATATPTPSLYSKGLCIYYMTKKS